MSLAAKFLPPLFPLGLFNGHKLDKIRRLSDAVKICIALEEGIVRKARRCGLF
jgi:hypothetical protein